MRKSWSLTAKLVATGITFLVLALLSIGLTLWVSWNLEGGAAAVNEAGRLRMMTYRMALALPDASAPPPGAWLLAEQFESSLQLLDRGDPSRPLFVPWGSHHHLDTVRSRWRELRDGWLAGPGTSREEMLPQADAFVQEVDGFVAAIENELARWTAILHLFQLAMMALAIGSAVALLYTSYLLVLNPLARLRRGLAAIRGGDLSMRIEVESADEFGEMSAVFNEMAQTLQSLYERLEERVREKTERLEVKRRRLAGLYEVSTFLAGATQLDEMAQGFAPLVRRIAGADASAVRWSDQENRRYILLASDNMPPSLQVEGRCLDSGMCHCGQRADRATTQAVCISSDDAPDRKLLCERAGYRTLVSVPVRLHEQVLGELDLFYRGRVDLGPEERELLDMVANHLAGAMESLRASALEREAAVAEERSMLARELHDSIAQSLAFLKIQVKLLREAVRSGDSGATERIIAELDTGVRESYADVRELLVHFRTRTAEEDIEPALASTLNKFSHQTGLPAELRMDGHGVALAPDVQVQVLHIIQEALSNVRKHAAAHRVVLEVGTAPHWRFEVRDDGVGFDPRSHSRGETHVGLRIMQERALRIGAQVGIDSAPGRGCSVVLELPPSISTRPAGAEAALAA